MKALLHFKTLIFLTMLLAVIGSNKQLNAQTVWDGTTYDHSWYDADESEFYIYTAEELAGLAALVNGTNGATQTTFIGKTVHLMADIWLNFDGDSTNNWPMIGGAGLGDAQNATEPCFGGIFKGNGHQIYNLFCDRRASAGTNGTHRAGLFGTLRGNVTIDSVVLVRPKTRTGAAMCGTLVGSITGQSASSPSIILIERCLVIDADVRSGANNAGGLAGSAFAQSNTITSVTIRDCGVTGIIYAGGSWAGGIVGTDQKTQFRNCYFAGTVSINQATVSDRNWAGICTPRSGGATSITNCYSNFTGSGTYTRNGTVKTSAEMQTESFISNITTTADTVFKIDCEAQQNSGFPIMKWMSCGVPVAGITDICANIQTTLTASGWESYEWSTGETGESITVNPGTTTTYYVTGTSGTSSTIDSVTVNVSHNIQVTPSIAPSPDYGTITASTYSQLCTNNSPITISISAETGYYITRIVVNGATVENFADENPLISNYTYTISNPQETNTWNVVAHLSNQYYITTTTVLNDEDETVITATGLVTPNNGNLVITAFNDTTVYFHETARYAIEEVFVNDASYGAIDSFEFNNITEHYDIKIVYADDCGIAKLPYTEGFEDYATGASATFPDCYERVTSVSDRPYVYAGYAKTGSKSLYFYNSSPTTYNMIVFPMLKVENVDITDLRVRFHARTSNTGAI
ncbi:hypothetical protein LJC68_10535, partial [Bacteroidales bacterium OttesenSCG-928-B11]|nr:hypothetical protein [Bacteroidales bacterium OttesenSCG-928-B11]